MSQVPEKLMKLLQKLHALANCPTGNVNETAAAQARMSELMLQYGIESISAQPDLQKHLALDKQVPVWQQNLLSVLARAAGCRSIRLNKKDLWLVGDLGVAQAVEYQYRALLVDLKRLFVSMIGGKASGKEYNSFCSGAVHEIHKRLQEMKKQTTERVRREQGESSQALVWLEKGISNGDMHAVLGLGEGVRIVPTKRRAQTVNANAYDQGREAGRNIQLGSRASGALGGEKRSIR